MLGVAAFMISDEVSATIAGFLYTCCSNILGVTFNVLRTGWLLTNKSNENWFGKLFVLTNALRWVWICNKDGGEFGDDEFEDEQLEEILSVGVERRLDPAELFVLLSIGSKRILGLNKRSW